MLAGESHLPPLHHPLLTEGVGVRVQQADVAVEAGGLTGVHHQPVLPGEDYAVLGGPAGQTGLTTHQGQDSRVQGVQLGEGTAASLVGEGGRAGGGKGALKQKLPRLCPGRGGTGGGGGHHQ